MEQFNELKKQLEKDRDLKFEEASKELNNVKLEVESRRRDMEARQRDVEAAVAEVLYVMRLMSIPISVSLKDKLIV